LRQTNDAGFQVFCKLGQIKTTFGLAISEKSYMFAIPFGNSTGKWSGKARFPALKSKE
jgi:hypothetical protein